MLSPKQLRHDLHKHPELSLQETRTTGVIKENIEALFSKNNVNFPLLKPLKTGLLVNYNPIHSNSYILLRADIDALPIKEKTGVKFQSINDNMHACGHDIHTAILYGTLIYVIKNEINKNILFLFQPAEEEHGGAKNILKSGVLDENNIKRAFALHLSDDYPQGVIASRPKILFASSLEMDIKYQGRSAHIANPEKGKDALFALTRFLEKSRIYIESRDDPTLLGFGRAYAGKARNIIAEQAILKGTLRTKTMAESKTVLKDLLHILDKISNKLNIDYQLIKGAQYREVYNDPLLFSKARYALSRELSFINCEMKMTAEDFGYFTEKYPSFMFWLGTRKNNKTGLHTPYFLPDDEVIDMGIDINKILLAI